MRVGWTWGAAVTVLGALLTIGVVVHGRTATTVVPSPYGLSRVAKFRVRQYFREAFRHHEYELTSFQVMDLMHRKEPMVLIDVRQPLGKDGFDAGHIQGAYNIPLQWMGKELLATHKEQEMLPFHATSGLTKDIPITFFPLPHHVPIVLMCYDGNGGEMTPALLRILGYKAYSLKDGVSLWNGALNVWPNWSQHRLISWPMVSGPGVIWTDPDKTSSTSYVIGEKWQKSVASMLSSMSRPYARGYAFPWTIDPDTLAADIAGEHPPLIIDLRSPTSYRAGHIAGSINIPFRELGMETDRLNPDRPIVLVSQSLQKAAQANGILRILGYRSYVLKQGLAAWNRDQDHVPTPHHYPIEGGMS